MRRIVTLVFGFMIVVSAPDAMADVPIVTHARAQIASHLVRRMSCPMSASRATHRRGCYSFPIAIGNPNGPPNSFVIARGQWGARVIDAGGYRLVQQGARKGVNTAYRVERCTVVHDVRRCAPVPTLAILAWMVPVHLHGDGVRGVLYTPASEALRMPRIIESGRTYLRTLIDRARAMLSRRGVLSLAFPGERVTTVVPRLTTEVLTHVEAIDHGEFAACRGRSACVQQLVDMNLITLATNREHARRYAASRASARGLMQFICPTWRSVTTRYPRADLSRDCQRGTRDHLASVMAAILLNDLNLVRLEPRHRQFLRRHADAFTKYSAAAYNGNPYWADQAITHCGANWTERSCRWLRSETVVYLDKVDAVILARR